MNEQKPTAIISISVWVDCPKCGKSIDLTEDDDGSFLNPLLSNDWHRLINFEVFCECGHDFAIDGVEY